MPRVTQRVTSIFIEDSHVSITITETLDGGASETELAEYAQQLKGVDESLDRTIHDLQHHT